MRHDQNRKIASLLADTTNTPPSPLKSSGHRVRLQKRTGKMLRKSQPAEAAYGLSWPTLAHGLRDRAQRHPDRPALSFLTEESFQGSSRNGSTSSVAVRHRAFGGCGQSQTAEGSSGEWSARPAACRAMAELPVRIDREQAAHSALSDR